MKGSSSSECRSIGPEGSLNLVGLATLLLSSSTSLYICNYLYALYKYGYNLRRIHNMLHRFESCTIEQSSRKLPGQHLISWGSCVKISIDSDVMLPVTKQFITCSREIMLI